MHTSKVKLEEWVSISRIHKAQRSTSKSTSETIQGKSKTPKVRHRRTSPRVVYRTKSGFMIRGSAERVLKSSLMAKYKGKVQLIFTSPPFPLNRKKKYGNFTGEKYSEWLADFAKIFSEFLTEDGSIVIEMGNAWVKGEPTMSTLALKALLAFQEKGNLKLCQQFIAYNKARLPSPAQWVNVKRIRVKDAYTSIWWMSPVATPKADNRRVLKEYSESMHELLSSKKYNSGRRPSEHLIGAKSFLKDNKGAIPPNVIIVSNTIASDRYVNYCRNRKITPHPARMPKKIPEFFIKFLTDPGDIVVDPFAGSNVTGWVADILGRKWISIEKDESYANVSKIRFAKSVTTKKLGRKYAKRGKRGPKK